MIILCKGQLFMIMRAYRETWPFVGLLISILFEANSLGEADASPFDDYLQLSADAW